MLEMDAAANAVPLPTIIVLYRHADFIAIYKPGGYSVQGDAEAPPLLPMLAKAVGVPRLWLVHRLDKVTSGVLLLALNASTASYLAEQFAQQRIHKTYWAVAEGKPGKKQGWIKGNMVRARRGAWKLVRSQQPTAITYFDSISLAPMLRLYRLMPHSGKTHQLRVAMKSLGCPILGDVLYGGVAAQGVYLHAYKLAFEYQGDSIVITATPPSYWPSQWYGYED